MSARTDLRNAYIVEKLIEYPLEELQFALGRYCGPHNMLLAEKKFGFHPTKEQVEQAIRIREFEEAILDSE